MEKIVFEYLIGLGFKTNHIGYRYIKSLVLASLNGSEILPLKLVGYEMLSKDFGKSKESIEKNIQNAISSAWTGGNIENLYREFGSTIDISKGKPTNKQLILTVVDKIRNYVE